MTITAQLISQLNPVTQQEIGSPDKHNEAEWDSAHALLFGESDEELRLDTTAVMLRPLGHSSASQKNK